LTPPDEDEAPPALEDVTAAEEELLAVLELPVALLLDAWMLLDGNAALDAVVPLDGAALEPPPDATKDAEDPPLDPAALVAPTEDAVPTDDAELAREDPPVPLPPELPTPPELNPPLAPPLLEPRRNPPELLLPFVSSVVVGSGQPTRTAHANSPVVHVPPPKRLVMTATCFLPREKLLRGRRVSWRGSRFPSPRCPPVGCRSASQPGRGPCVTLCAKRVPEMWQTRANPFDLGVCVRQRQCIQPPCVGGACQIRSPVVPSHRCPTCPVCSPTRGLAPAHPR